MSTAAARSALVAAGFTAPPGKAVAHVETGARLAMAAGLSESAARQLAAEMYAHFTGLRLELAPPAASAAGQMHHHSAGSEEQLAASIIATLNARIEA